MNDIFLCDQNIGAITNQIAAERHKHWMYQIFIGIEKDFLITIEEQKIKTKGILVNQNKNHSIYTLDTQFTLLINPISTLGRKISYLFLNKESFYVLNQEQLTLLTNQINPFEPDYQKILTAINQVFVPFPITRLDQRVEWLIK